MNPISAQSSEIMSTTIRTIIVEESFTHSITTAPVTHSMPLHHLVRHSPFANPVLDIGRLIIGILLASMTMRNHSLVHSQISTAWSVNGAVVGRHWSILHIMVHHCWAVVLRWHS